MMQAMERLWLTEDRKALVPDGHKDAAVLYAAPGDNIPDSMVDRYGLVGGLSPLSAKAAGAKQDRSGEDKQRHGGEDKQRHGGEDKSGEKAGEDKDTRQSEAHGGGGDPAASALPADDLTGIKGIGAASAAKLVAAGIDSFAALAAVDPDRPPAVEGLGANPAWKSWADQASVMIADGENGL